MILLNFDFIDKELTENTIHYLQENKKKYLLNNAKRLKFNGKGFKYKTHLKEYIKERGFIDKKELTKKISSNGRRTTLETVNRLHKLIIKEAPLYIDTDVLYRLMLLSSNLMFTANEKICFTIMFEDPDKSWSAEEILSEAKKNNDLKLSKAKIEETLDRHLKNKDKTEALIKEEMKDGIKHYRIHFTNFVYYIRKFE